MILTPERHLRLKDDEDVGSPSRDGVTAHPPLLFGAGWDEAGKSTDQRKPTGCAITRFFFPSEIKTLRQRRLSNRADKEARNGMHMSLRGVAPWRHDEAIPNSRGDCHAAYGGSQHLHLHDLPSKSKCRCDKLKLSEEPHVWNRRIYRAA